MPSAGKPRWQQVTALVSLSAGGAVTGFSFVPHAAAELPAPTNTQIRLLALQQAAKPAAVTDTVLRSAIVNVAQYYLRVARGKTPAEMEAIIWQHDSVNGVDHGESCAAFASLTLELAAQVVGQQSWVTGGTSYPWPLHKWADVRVDPNSSSPGIVSVLQDAEEHHRWHPLGDGYRPLPGDWVLFDNHVEVVTKYAGGALSTIGGDSLPNFSVNPHEYDGSLADDGVVGFVNNGNLASSASKPASGAAASGSPTSSTPTSTGSTGSSSASRKSPNGTAAHGTAGGGSPAGSAPAAGSPAASAPRVGRPAKSESTGLAEVPGVASGGTATAQSAATTASGPGDAAIPGLAASARRLRNSAPARSATAKPTASRPAATTPSAAAPATPTPAVPTPATTTPGAVGPTPARSSAAPYARHRAAQPTAPSQDVTAQQAFISEIAPGAVAAQHKYGVPAAVTIAQAIDESGWGQSNLATKDHNLFGIKGTGPAGRDPLPTQEFENGHEVTRIASFRVYHDVAESIEDHGQLLATSPYYRQPMSYRHNADAFAAALTGIYATDPDYGAKLIELMHQYDLYRYDSVATATAPSAGFGAGTGVGAGSASAAAGADASIPGAAPVASAAPASTPGPALAPAGPRPATAPSTPRASTPAAAASRPSTHRPPISPASTSPASAPHASAPRAPASARNQAGGRGASIPGLPVVDPAQAPSQPTRAAVSADFQSRRTAARLSVSQYRQHMPLSVRQAFMTTAKVPLLHEEPLYRDVASYNGVPWQLLAACDWMQCRAQSRFSPVHGERLGSVNPDGTSYRTRSEALSQCATDLIELARAVYRIDLTAGGQLSLADLANVFAAFRWGGLLKLHRTSAMEFPYSVEGLTAQHTKMRWPNIADPHAPDKPGSRFRGPFGAVPVVLSLNYAVAV